MKQETAINFSFIEPMKALLVTALPAGDWIYELKFDGYRALAFKSDSDVQLVSRNRTSFNKAYPQLIEALKSLPAKSAIIDGEIAALNRSTPAYRGWESERTQRIMEGLQNGSIRLWDTYFYTYELFAWHRLSEGRCLVACDAGALPNARRGLELKSCARMCLMPSAKTFTITSIHFTFFDK